MVIKLIISQHCNSCARAVKKLKEIAEGHPEISTEIMNIGSFADKRIFITPALIVDGELFSYGDIDEYKLLSKIN